MKLIVGLGNPGKEYEKTRHNIGYMVIDNYITDVSWKNDKLANTYKTKINNEDVLFIKPTTFMNLSGEAVSYYVNYYKIELSNILIIQDDMDLELGKLRLKLNSADGGHNGIKNIIQNLNTKNFLRLKIGISKPENNVIDYVLSKFTNEEQKNLNESLNQTKNIINDFINNENIERLMNKYN